MSEELTDRAEIILSRFEKKENVLNKLLWTLVVSIITMIGSVSILINTSVQNKKDIEHVRENAASRMSVVKLTESFDIYRSSVKELILDPNIKAAIDHFDAKMDKITEDIVMWNSEIPARSMRSEASKGGSK